MAAGREAGQRFTKFIIEVGHVAGEGIEGGLMFLEVCLQSLQDIVPVLAFGEGGEGELPLFEFGVSVLHRMIKVL